MGALLVDERRVCHADPRRPLEGALSPRVLWGQKAVAPAWLCRYNARPELFQVVKMQPVTNLFSYPRYWAECYGTAPFLPMSRAEMDKLGWDSCDIVLVTGDAYVDHPSFGMAVIGRMLESQGFRVGIIAQPDWSSKDDFMRLGKPNLFYGVTAGNMDSMINRYTADKKLRHDDAYTPGDVGGKRPDRATLVYTQRCKEAYKEVPVVIGGIEASLRRIAHYDYWSETIRRSILIDAKADIRTIADDAKVMKGSTNWHLGYGADLQVGYQLTSCLKLGIYSGLTRLTGERVDGMPEHLHKNNFVWESGVRLGLSLPFNNHQQ
jgi:hypothetical protein